MILQVLVSDYSSCSCLSPFILTYHPFNNNVKDIIYSNFNILTNDTNTKSIFDTPPLMAFRRDKNLKDHLVRTSLTTSQQPGTSPCQHRLCQTCTHINQSTTITNQNRSFNIRSHFTCSSSCVIYCIICTKSQSFYIGETSRQINNRFGEHKRNVRNRSISKKTMKTILTATYPNILIQLIIQLTICQFLACYMHLWIPPNAKPWRNA